MGRGEEIELVSNRASVLVAMVNQEYKQARIIVRFNCGYNRQFLYANEIASAQ